MKFKDQVVLVTGASRGIGAAIAKSFAAEGAFVIVNYLQNEKAAEEVVAACQALGGDAWAIQADVTVEEDVNRLAGDVLLEVGKIDVVVNNAFKAYQFDPENRKLAWDLKWEDVQEQLDGSLRAVHHMTQAVIPAMKKQGGGSIINMVSNLIARPVVPYIDYTTAKGALQSYSRNLAAELGAFGIRMNCVAPGLVYPTDASKHTKEDVKEMIISQTPLGRIAMPIDIVGPVLFLASEWAAFVTGQTIYVDGGFVMN
ncbi:SDR family oxidoreductase [Sporosarcina sp. HYO08]|uniref:SDR family oxidoreductase n=1 Tax=Sporosarcina sp. HYO08 TaxID=1759557 RepID=UPI000796218B|nr:SDR family oxidoreductase [Sporosarcina sp. HYO08]KXH87460.1 3-oxoacyl-ACP reductase [Sporosarcina sp. HYO08]